MSNVQTSNESESSYYTACRKIAKLTQEQAIPFLGIVETSTLSNYENLKVKPPDKVVQLMVVLYRTPDLMTWHIKHWHPEYAPYIIEPTKITSNETFHSSVVRIQTIFEDLARSLNISLMDDNLDENEKMELSEKKSFVDLAIKKAVAASNYIGSFADSREKLIVKKVEKNKSSLH